MRLVVFVEFKKWALIGAIATGILLISGCSTMRVKILGYDIKEYNSIVKYEDFKQPRTAEKSDFAPIIEFEY